MNKEIDFSKCIHFDTPRCPNRNLDIFKKAAFTASNFDGITIDQVPDYDPCEVNKICGNCDKYRV